MNAKRRCIKQYFFSLTLLLAAGAPASAQQSGTDAVAVAVNESVEYRLVSPDESGGALSGGTGGYYQLSLDGGRTYGRPRPRSTTIRLRDSVFDPVVQDQQHRQTGEVYLVQFEIEPLAALVRRIEAAGGRVLDFVPRQTLVVRAGSETMASIEAMPFVRWIGPYAPAYKTPAAVRQRLRSDNEPTPVRYVVALFSRAADEVDAVVQAIGRSGGTVVLRSEVASHFLQAELTGPQLQALLNHDNVRFVEPWTPPESDMDIVRQVSGADYIEARQPFYTGRGVTGEVLDNAIWNTHEGFLPPRWHGEPNIANAHGTPVYGIVFGNGGADPQARGLLPEGDGIFASWVNVADRPAHTAELVDPDGPYRAVFQTNSWGSARTTEYTSVSAEMDQIIFDTDLLITQSQSNAGDRDSRPQAWAKNIVSVGGVRHFDTADFSDDAWRASASIGPAADGRIKPDLAHFYDAVFTTEGSSDTAHEQFGGTSAATPIAAGHFGLAFRMWADGILTGEGTPGSGADVFQARPGAATMRALMINTARQYPFSGTEHDLTRVHQGWGLPDVETLHQVAERNDWRLPLVVDEEHVLRDQQRRRYVMDVSEDRPWLKATMVYMDPPGNPAAAIATMNDLSLRLTAPDGSVYWGNAGLLEGNWSTAGGESSTVDTVENVFIDAAQPGQWVVEVIADRIVQDGRVETPEMDADYALVVTCAGQDQCRQRSENIAPEVAVVSPAEGAVFNTAEEVLIQAEAMDVDGTVTAVEFFVDGAPVGQASQAPYRHTWEALTAGEFELTAVATDSDGATTVSAPVTVRVDAGSPPALSCRYAVSSDWNDGFVAVVRITNNSTEAVDGWDVQWEYPEAVEIIRYWSVQLEGDNPYIATPLSWNSTVSPGQTVEFGLEGRKLNSETSPPAPELTGSGCGD